ncbi:metalloendopeptidase [Plakobranchus ocellatus]|uniref:Metalloendopeptidase n=1 Tax=Plakobranchus ocellatus TaxID=259542 RepID=A0AAV4AW15_9GAST|nr:metalloendopeptidase [Plakobranchus ocellatus]
MWISLFFCIAACVFLASQVNTEGDRSEGRVKRYLLARDEVEAEQEAFHQTARPGDTPDPNSDAMLRLREARDDLNTAELSPNHLAELLEGDPGLHNGGTGELALNKPMRKRSIEASELRRWTKGIVPYVFTDQTTEYNRQEIKRTFRTYERFSCMRYIPWQKVGGVTTNKENKLGHESYLTFVQRNGCWAEQGNKRKKTGGQNISCCGGFTCVHEVGHAMGESHEHQSPNADRNRMIQINMPGIRDGEEIWYSQSNPKYILSLGYDLSSSMHYSPWSFAKPGKKTYYLLYPELSHGDSYYYLMREVSLMHKCQDRCTAMTITCENDGYLTLVDNKCSCRCIPGLDPATGCTTIFKSDPQGLAFPGGQYVLPAHSSGCPQGSFSFGSRKQVNDGGNDKSSAYDLGGVVSDKTIEQQFCVMDSPSNGFSWPGGNFCIYRRGDKCPEGFNEGSVQYDDRPTAASPNAKSGELPDGVFDDDTRFEFCCMNSGFSQDDLSLPSREPFALIKQIDKDCHKVRGMHSEAVTLTINNADEGIAQLGGEHPVYFTKKTPKEYQTDFCMYKPAMIECGDIIELSEANPEVTIVSPEAPELECYWLLKAPPGERLQLDFSEFDIKGVPGSCTDDLEVRFARAGQPGINMCGRKWDKTIISINNTIHMRLSTYGDSTSHFTATIKLIKNADLCYAASDRGMTYVGDVSFTRNFEPCLPWNEVTHCDVNSFMADDVAMLLDGNKCRNPDQGTGFQPWCYVQAENCIRNYCDVCLIGKPYDVRDDCAEKKSLDQCDFQECAKTCADQYPGPARPVPASQMSCGPPGNDVVDSSLTEATKSTYTVGEFVTYKCNTGKTTRKRLCLSTGQWSFIGTACSECPNGFDANLNNGQCYLFVPHAENYAYASSYCEEKGGVVAFPMSEEDNAFLKSFTTYHIWIGITDVAEEGKFVTALGEPATFTKWKAPEPNNLGKGEHCSEIRKDSSWYDISCAHKRRFACQAPMMEVKACVDVSDKCSEHFEVNPHFCTNFTNYAHHQCRFTCGLCGLEDTPKCKVEGSASGTGETMEVTRGTVVTLTCPDDVILKVGDEVRVCTASGALTGTPLKCLKDCPPGWILNSDNMNCYKRFDAIKTHPDAESDCQSYRGSLATALDMKENDFVKALMSSLWPTLWLGLTDSRTEGQFVWMDGTALTFTHWSGGEPNNWGLFGEDCVQMLYDGRWGDNKCYHMFPYVCKVPFDSSNHIN